MKSEYEMLRNEMMQMYKSIDDFTIVLYTSVALILTFVLDEDEFYLCLVPFFVIVPLFLASEGKHHAVCRLAAYLYVFHEGMEYNWERRHHRYDSEAKAKKGIKKYRGFDRISPYFFLSIACCIFSIVKLYYSNYSCKEKIAFTIFVLFITTVIIAYMRSKLIDYVTDRQKMIDLWIKIKERNDYNCIVKTEKDIYHIEVIENGG